MKKALALTMAAALSVTMLAGCGGSASSGQAASTADSTASSEATAANPDKPYEGVTLHYAATDTEAAGAESTLR